MKLNQNIQIYNKPDPNGFIEAYIRKTNIYPNSKLEVIHNSANFCGLCRNVWVTDHRRLLVNQEVFLCPHIEYWIHVEL